MKRIYMRVSPIILDYVKTKPAIQFGGRFCFGLKNLHGVEFRLSECLWQEMVHFKPNIPLVHSSNHEIVDFFPS
jgi:hypothetical protein